MLQETRAQTAQKIQQDFDRLALLTADGWDHNRHYHAYLLRHVPSRCTEALDIGCGSGAFARLLAERAERVLALDLSPRMIEAARQRSRGHPNITFLLADATAWPLAEAWARQRFDCIAVIATLHHLPLEETLVRLKSALKPGGTLVVLGLFQAAGPGDMLASAAAVPASLILTALHKGRLREPRQLREAWAEHGRSDVYPTLTQVRQVCGRLLPGARVKRHLLWRYSLIWRSEIRG